MTAHEFMFKPGNWIGEGKITFSSSPEHLRFYTKWKIEQESDKSLRCDQQVEIESGEESSFNHFIITDVLPTSFAIELTNQELGTLNGKGIIDAKTVAWEFRNNPDFEGFEVYELQENGDYMIHAEYSSSDQFRTIIDGRIWKKAK